MIKIICLLPELRSLSLELKKYRKQGRYDLSNLAELCKLERLSLTGSLVHVLLPALPALKELLALDQVQPVFQGRYDQLEVLVVESFQTGRLPLNIFPRLTTLGVRKCSLRADMFENASQDREVHIVNLDLTYSKLSGGIRSFFQHFPNLSRLNVSFCGFSEDELIFIVGYLTQVTALNVTGNEVSDKVLAAITSPLTKLEIGASSVVTGKGLEGLACSLGPSLSHLSLGYCGQVSHSALAQLGVWFPQLTTLNLSGWNLSDGMQRKLSHLNCSIIT